MHQVEIKTTETITYVGGELFYNPQDMEIYTLRYLGGSWIALNLCGNGNWCGSQSTVVSAIKGLICLGDCKITIEPLNLIGK